MYIIICTNVNVITTKDFSVIYTFEIWKKRTIINKDMVKIIWFQWPYGQHKKEMSVSDSISLSCETKLCNKISQGLCDDLIIVKNERTSF